LSGDELIRDDTDPEWTELESLNVATEKELLHEFEVKFKS
jgi:hypothetical protein